MEYSKVCKQCGKEFIAKRKHAECCSAICRARFSEGLGPKLESESESAQPPKQAINHIEALYQATLSSETVDQQINRLLDLVEYQQSIILKMEQKLDRLLSGYVAPTPTLNITVPSDVQVNVVFDEKAARERTIKATLSAIDDF